MWVEVTGKETGMQILINTKFVQSVYPLRDNSAVVIDLGGYANNIFKVKGTYKEIRDLITVGELTR